MSNAPTATQADPAAPAIPDAIAALAANEALPLMGDNMVQRVCALWAGAGHTLGFDAFTVEGDDFASAEPNLVSMAALYNGLHPINSPLRQIFWRETSSPSDPMRPGSPTLPTSQRIADSCISWSLLTFSQKRWWVGRLGLTCERICAWTPLSKPSFFGTQNQALSFTLTEDVSTQVTALRAFWSSVDSSNP